MQKKSQITVFIIAGIIILVAVGFLVYLKKAPGIEEVPPSMAHIKIFIEHCMKQTTENALLLIGVQGGYIYLDNVDSFDTYYSGTAVWYDNGVSKIPSLEAVQEEIERYMEEEINIKCLKDFETFNEDIRFGLGKADVTIMPEKVFIDMTMPVRLVEKENVYKISDFHVEVPVDIAKAFEVGEKIVEMEMENPDMIDITYLADLELENSRFSYGDVMLYSVVDYENEVVGMPFRLIFANDFSEG